MTAAANDLLEMVLRECEIAKGEPWYPSEYAAATGVSRTALDGAVDQLRLGGLVRMTEWVAGKGQGYVLTPAGEEVLKNPRLLHRLRTAGVSAVAVKETREPAAEEEHATGWDRANAIRDALLSPHRPVVTMTLLGLNVLNFLIGLMLVVQLGGSVDGYVGFGNDRPIQLAREITGAVRPADLDQGHWWRLLTCAFVHFGLLHLGMNMYALYVLGPLMERLWGRLRYLLLYLLTAIIGSYAGVVLQPGGMLAGASTALCGLLGMTFTWLLLNKRYLPPQVAASFMRSTMFNIILVVAISFIFRGDDNQGGVNVSWAGHLGGGVAGIVLALPFNYLSFNKASSRQLDRGAVALLVLLGLGLLGFVGWQIAENAPTLGQIQAQASQEQALAKYLVPMRKTIAENERADEAFVAWANKKLAKDKALTAVNHAEAMIDKMQQLLAQAPTADDPSFGKAVEYAQSYFEKWQDYFKKAKQFFERGGVTRPEWHALQAREVRALQKAEKLLFESKLDPRPR